VNTSTVQISHPACRATARCWSTSLPVPTFCAFSSVLSPSTSCFELPWEGRSTRCSQLSLTILPLFAALLSRCLPCAHHGLCTGLQRTVGFPEGDSHVSWNFPPKISYIGQHLLEVSETLLKCVVTFMRHLQANMKTR